MTCCKSFTNFGQLTDLELAAKGEERGSRTEFFPRLDILPPVTLNVLAMDRLKLVNSPYR